MDLREAWVTLGRDPDRIMQLLSGIPDIHARAEAIESILKKARKLGKILMAKNHPDVNPGDDLAEERFKRIQLALTTIEAHTKTFQDKVKELTTRKINKNDVVIVIGK